MSMTAIELCSNALVKLGARSINSFRDDTAEARVASSLYPLILDVMLCAHPWSFATAKVKLARLSTEPVSDWAYAYLLPDGFLKALSPGNEARGRYQIVNRQLHTNADQVVLAYIFRPSEGDFPPHFTSALVARCAAEFCLPLTGSVKRSERLARVAENTLRLAKLIDNQKDDGPRWRDEECE